MSTIIVVNEFLLTFTYSNAPAASAGRGLSPSRAAQSGLDYLAEAATSVSAVDWDTDGRGVRVPLDSNNKHLLGLLPRYRWRLGQYPVCTR